MRYRDGYYETRYDVIKAWRAAGYTTTAIGHQLGLTRQSVGRILKSKRPNIHSYTGDYRRRHAPDPLPLWPMTKSEILQLAPLVEPLEALR